MQNKESFIFLAEIVLALRENLVSKEVDWLAFEDPYIFEKDPEEYKKERKCREESERRWKYVQPTINYLIAHFGGKNE